MIRLHLQVIVIATFVLPSLILAQETKKDPTDILFEQILAETISEQQAEDKKATAPSTRQVGGPTATQGEQFTRPIVTTKNWNQNQTPTFSTPSHTGNNITAQQTSASTRTPAKNTVRSVSGSVSMDLIAPSDINLNQTCTVRIQLKNVGADTLDNVQFNARLPKHVKFKQSRPQPTSNENGTLQFDGIRLAARSNSFIELDVIPVEKLAMNIGTEIKYSNQQQIAINVRQPQLDVQVVGPEKFILGDTKQYNITVTNRGDGVAHDVKLTGEFPKGLQKLKASNTMVEQLAPGQSAQIVVQTQALESGTKKVAFKVESTELEPVTKNLDTLIVQPELQVTATGPSVNFLNREGIYRIEIDNAGQVDCSDVKVVLSIPEDMSVSTISRQAQYNEVSRQLTWSFDQLPAGQKHEIQLKAQCVTEGLHTCSIFVSSQQTIEKEFRINTTVATRADVSINIADENGPAQIGSPTQFQVVVANKGSRSAEDVQIVVELPVSMAPVVNEDYAINQYENTIQFSANQIRPGEKKTFSFSAVGSEQGEHIVRGRLSMRGSERQLIAEDSVYVFETDQSKVGQKLEPQIRR